MSPPDRKVVHDTVNDIDGVTTVSEGEDHRRRVVILPRVSDDRRGLAPPAPAAASAQLERARSLGFLGPGPVEDHLVHAAGFVAALAEVTGRVVDLGSGGGVPGLPSPWPARTWSWCWWTPARAGAEFLEAAVAALGLEDRVRVVVRAGPRWWAASELRGTADAVVARGFGRPRRRPSAPLPCSGSAAAWSSASRPTDRRPLAGAGLGPLGLVDRRARRRDAPAPGAGAGRACPDEYPRRDGVPAKRPLF